MTPSSNPRSLASPLCVTTAYLPVLRASSNARRSPRRSPHARPEWSVATASFQSISIGSQGASCSRSRATRRVRSCSIYPGDGTRLEPDRNRPRLRAARHTSPGSTATATASSSCSRTGRTASSPANPDHARTVAEAFPPSTVASLPLLAEENGRLLVDATDVAHARLERRRAARCAQTQQGTYTVARDRSSMYRPYTKAFPDNTEIDVSLTFATTGRPGGTSSRSFRTAKRSRCASI